MYLRVARRFPVCNHKEVVAEYRQHGASMTRNLPRMLSHSVGVLRAQHVKGRKDYEEARKEGLKQDRGKYGDPLVEEVRAQLKDLYRLRALRGLLVLARYYPQGLALLSERRMERHRLAWRIRARKQDLEYHEWQLKELEDTRASESALEEERQEVQVLRKRIRKLERRIQDLDRESQSGLVSRIRRLANRGVSHLRSRVLGE